MRKPDDSAQATATEATPQVRSAFLRGTATQCQWAADFTPPLTHEDPLIQDLGQRLWTIAKPMLELSDEGLSRLTFKRALDQAASDLFAHADIGIKSLATAKQLLLDAFGEIDDACEVVAVEAAPVTGAESEPALVARLAATPPAMTDGTPGQARLCLSLGDVVLKLDLIVPSQSWLYRGYQRLRQNLEKGVERAMNPRPSLPRRSGRLGMMTDDRELTIGLRHQRQPEDGHTRRETTLSLRSKR